MVWGPAQAREYPDAEKTLRLAAHLLIKAMLQYLPDLLPQPDFGDCWQRVLQVLQVSRPANPPEHVLVLVPRSWGGAAPHEAG